jgi:hypothetical protein
MWLGFYFSAVGCSWEDSCEFQYRIICGLMYSKLCEGVETETGISSSLQGLVYLLGYKLQSPAF